MIELRDGDREESPLSLLVRLSAKVKAKTRSVWGRRFMVAYLWQRVKIAERAQGECWRRGSRLEQLAAFSNS